MAPESIGLYNRYEGILNQSHQYLLDDIRLLEDIPAFIQDASYILSSASSPFLVDQKNYTITIPTLADPEWGHQKIVWAGKKTPLITAIEILTEKYASLLPSICTNTTLPLEYIDTQLIFFLMSDIVGAINIYALHQKKRGIIKPRSIIHENISFCHDPSKKEQIEKTIKAEVTETLDTHNSIMKLESIEDLVYFLNHSSLPMHMDITRNFIRIDKMKIKHIKDLKNPLDYIVPVGGENIPLLSFMQSCAKTWPGYFNDFIRARNELTSKIDKNGAEKIYKAFFISLMKIYLGITKKSLKFVFDDGSNTNRFETINMRIKNDNMNNNVVQPTKKPEPHIPPAPKLKRKLPKNEQQEQTIVNADLFVTLGYHKSFATKLYNFCVSQMMKSDESFTVTELVASRTALGHMTIGSFFKDPKTKSYIHAFDRIFEYHLNDRNMGYKDFSIISN